MARNISGTFPDRASAERAASDLRTAGFPPAEIGLVAQTRTGPTDTGQRLAPGTRTITAAIIGSLIVGLCRAAAVHLAPQIELFVIYGVMALVLVARPYGLFVRAQPRKI